MTESNIKAPKQAVLYSITAPDEKQEARFKAFGRALRIALSRSGNDLPSSKGKL